MFQRLLNRNGTSTTTITNNINKLSSSSTLSIPKNTILLTNSNSTFISPFVSSIIPSTSSSLSLSIRSFHSSTTSYKVTSLRNEIKRNEKVAYAPLENLVKQADNNSTLLEKIEQAQYKIFGTVKGNGQRTGRKRLRQGLRGSTFKAWYGNHLNDLLPENLFPIKEDYYRMEVALQRLGKSRITGKIKQPLQSTVDQLTFEDALPDIIEKADDVHYRELLFNHEIVELEQALSNVTTKEERLFIENSYKRIALDRSQRPDAWIEYMDKVEKEAAGTAGTPPPAAEDEKGTKKRVNTFEFRQGLTDKRQWGRGGSTNSKPKDTVTTKDAATTATTEADKAKVEEGKKTDSASPAATTEAPGAVATAGKTDAPTSATSAEATSTAPTDASATETKAKEVVTPPIPSKAEPIFINPEVTHLSILQGITDNQSKEFTEKYQSYVSAVAKDKWDTLVQYKNK